MQKTFLITVAIVVVIFGKVDYAFAWRWILYHEDSFEGRVIDAETKEPLGGVVIVANYRKQMMGLEANTHDVDSKSAVTDKNGEFYIPPYTTVMAPWYLKEFTEITIDKSWYQPDFLIVPVKNVNVVKSIKWKDPQHIESIEQEVIDEGIVYIKKWRENFSDKEKVFSEGLIRAGSYPFVPLKNAEPKVRNMEIPFEDIEREVYSKDIKDLWRVWKGIVPEPFKVYTIIGLKKFK